MGIGPKVKPASVFIEEIGIAAPMSVNDRNVGPLYEKEFHHFLSG
jgi:hypothetical protein